MKQALRNHWILVRSQLQTSRRKQAESKLLEEILPLTKNHQDVLSFISFRNEISTAKLNDHLSANNHLCLPKVHLNELQLYRVQSISRQCVPGVWGLLEPDPAQCEKVSEMQITLILVPGLSFDNQRHRLGYGKGYYDRLLARLKPSAQTYGIGFKEQYSKTLLPVETHDVSLDHLLLF